ncbi:unnamed protein product [Arctia plantaginis]|uniref:Transmembrane protein 53 n=2 Tax=Arctia plantaginis TaxID=874455 RepID=A0A8S0Z0C0_ARCPL|nr:unnamed protein product [Arctia plantaginis]
MEVCRLQVVASRATIRCRRIINQSSRPLLQCVPMTFVRLDRGVHMQSITTNMQYLSNDSIKLKVDPNTMKLDQNIKKPLCLMMIYMTAKPKHVLKYADLYLTKDFDVISVSCTPTQLMWPAMGSQVIADRLLSFLESNSSEFTHPLVVHGFSIGAYLWAELLVQTPRNKKRYQPILERIAAQIWDSPADVDEVPIGAPLAVFPNNKFLQNIFRLYIRAHMKLLHNVATKHYMRATEVYHASPCKAPGLFLVSKTDPIGAEKRSRRAAASWEQLGIKCNFKCWDRSPHVQHYLRHPEEYKSVLYSHLEECGVLKNSR